MDTNRSRWLNEAYETRIKRGMWVAVRDRGTFEVKATGKFVTILVRASIVGSYTMRVSFDKILLCAPSEASIRAAVERLSTEMEPMKAVLKELEEQRAATLRAYEHLLQATAEKIQLNIDNGGKGSE